MKDFVFGESQARAFVATHGSPLARLRVGVCVGTEPPERVLEFIASAQRPDGAFLFPDCAESDPVAGTLRALSILCGVERLRCDAAERAVLWLVRSRSPEGVWAVRDRGERAAHLASGFLAGFLARTPFAPVDVLDGAGHWLHTRWEPDLVRGGDFAMIAAYTHFFANAPHEAGDAILQWCGRELERGVRDARIPALFALRVFALCDAPGVPGARLRAPDLLAPLAAEQAGDGGWFPAWPGPWRVEATLEALAVARRFGTAGAFAGGA